MALFRYLCKKMLPKIRYRLVYNYAGRLNKDGRAPVAVECRQGKRKIYVSTDVLLYPQQWDKGRVVNHDNADRLTAYLYKRMHAIEDIELTRLLKGMGMTLLQLKEAVRSGMHPSALISDFVDMVIVKSANRKDSTKAAYRYLVRSIDEFRGGMTLGDLDHEAVEQYRTWMTGKGLSYNTVVGRLKTLRCIFSEAVKRNVIDMKDDPFKNIVIGEMKPRKEYLRQSELRRIENVSLSGREAHVRDAFMFMCYTGIRYSDFCNMRSGNLVRNRLAVDQLKTGHLVILPLDKLFGGKPLEILSRYESIEAFARIGCNSSVNRILKDVGVKAGVEKRLHLHLGRKVFGTMLNQSGLKPQEIQYLLGHQRLSTTFAHYSFTLQEQVERSLKKAFKESRRK